MTAVAWCPGRCRLSVWYSSYAKVSSAGPCRICSSYVWCTLLWVAVGSGPIVSVHFVSAVFSLLHCGTYRRGLKPVCITSREQVKTAVTCKTMMFILRSDIVSFLKKYKVCSFVEAAVPVTLSGSSCCASWSYSLWVSDSALLLLKTCIFWNIFVTSKCGVLQIFVVLEHFHSSNLGGWEWPNFDRAEHWKRNILSMIRINE